MVDAPTNLISLNERGVAYITGTRMKVAEIVRETTKLAYSPEEVLEAHPHLTLSQVHAALSYYYSHRDEIDAFQREQDSYFEEFCEQNEPRVSRKELEARRNRARAGISDESPSFAQIKEEGGQYS
ncbi:MAG TPA: DUF433 domain-containing protein [Chthonomonadaceae bacterium]|nr:DUF433 domain-containing protein [Chthonomonadaceae bacterium]